MWEPYEDGCAAQASTSGAPGGGAVLSFELEAVFDEQSFTKAKRALRARLRGGVVALDATLAHDDDENADDAFAVVRAALRDDEACFVLFRTATWALWTWAPAGAADGDAYVAAAAALRADLGGDVRIPYEAKWRSPDDVALDRRVVQALPLGYDRLVEVEGGHGSRDRDAPEVSPEPREVPDPREVRYAL